MLTHNQLRAAAEAIDKTFRSTQARAQMSGNAAAMEHPSIVGAAMMMNALSNALRAAAAVSEAQAEVDQTAAN